MRATDLVATVEAEEGFYPTPEKVAKKLLEGLEFYRIKTVLEPSAGKGNLVDVLSRKFFRDQEFSQYRSDYKHIYVDCIEIDPYLRSILAYEFCGQKEKELVEEYSRLREKEEHFDAITRSYGQLTEEEKNRKSHLLYADMSAEEQSVVDGFHGDGAAGTGADEYAKVLARSQYFLSEPVREVPLLTAGA